MTTLSKLPSRFIILSLSLGIFITLMGCSGSHIQIVQNGESSYEIVIPSEADPTILHAAEELRHYIFQSSGADILVATKETHDSDRPSIKVGFEPSNAPVITTHTVAYTL